MDFSPSELTSREVAISRTQCSAAFSVAILTKPPLLTYVCLTRSPCILLKSLQGMALNAPIAAASNSDSTSGGVLHWLQPDSSFYEGNASVQTVVTSPNSTSDWLVQMDGWTFSSGGKSISGAGQDLQVSVDPYYNNIYVPQDEAHLICKLDVHYVDKSRPARSYFL
jgi:hypothetical protein